MPVGKAKQARFKGNGTNVTCGVCHLKYIHPIEAKIHTEYHTTFTKGPKWQGTNRVGTERFKRYNDVELYTVDAEDTKQVAATAKVLELVDRELGAADSPTHWRQGALTIVATQMGRAVGIVVTEPVSEEQGRWMMSTSRQVVPNQVNRLVKIGIARVWVCGAWRRRGLGIRLLKAVQAYLMLSPQQIAFSQPSNAGGKLAQTFCGVTHKLGQVLIPVYVDAEMTQTPLS